MARPNVRNPELLEAMAAVAARGAELPTAAIKKSMAAGEADELAVAARIYKALRGAVVIVPGHETPMSIDKQREIFTRTLREPDGCESFPVYTDFDTAPADARLHVMPVTALCKNLMPLGVSIHVNPGTPHGGVAPAYWVRAIAEGSIDMPQPVAVLETQERIRGFRPAGLTAAQRLRLTQGLVASRAVSGAYVVEGVFADNPSALLVGVVVDRELTVVERKVLTTELFAWVQPALTESQEVYFEVLNPESGMIATLKNVSPVFYRRSS